MGYETDIVLEQQFARTIKQILGLCFIGQSKYLDQKEATDFAVFQIDPIKVAVRLRRYNQYLIGNRKDEFTIRWSRPSGVKTEIHKIHDGLVDYILYGFVGPQNKKIIRYFIGDLRVFIETDPHLLGPYKNVPPDSELVACRLSDLPDMFFVHKYGF